MSGACRRRCIDVAKRHAAQADAPAESAVVRLLDLKSAAKYVGVSYWTMRSMVQAKALPVVQFTSPMSGVGRPMRRVLVDRRDLDALIDKSRVGGRAA